MHFASKLAAMVVCGLILSLYEAAGISAQTFPVQGNGSRTGIRFDVSPKTHVNSMRVSRGFASRQAPNVVELPMSATSPYKIIQLNNFFGTAMNNRGEVIGGDILYTGGRMVTLPSFYPGGFVAAAGINDRGVVVGSAGITGECTDAAMWIGKRIVDLGRGPGLCRSGALGSTQAVSVNNAGVAVGVDEYDCSPSNPSCRHDALEFSRGKVSVLRKNARALGINDSGEIIGQDLSNFRFFVLPSTPPGCCGISPSSVVQDINQRGHIVGTSTLQSSESEAYLYTRGRSIPLGTLRGTTNSYANALNECDDVVGLAYSNDNLVQHAFLWKAGKIVDVNSLLPSSFPFVLNDGVDINDRGEILADGYRKSDRTSDASFLLMPR